jgi:hypothetical protein
LEKTLRQVPPAGRGGKKQGESGVVTNLFKVQGSGVQS